MYYKVINKESEMYKNLHFMRTWELEAQKENEQAIKDRIGLEWKGVYGTVSQQNFRRVPQYTGFCFLEPEKVDLKVWQKLKTHINVFVPKIKTKAGKEISTFLKQELKAGNFNSLLQILGITNSPRRFTLPFVEIYGETIAIFLDDQHEPTDENVIEITKKEFYEITSSEHATAGTN